MPRLAIAPLVVLALVGPAHADPPPPQAAQVQQSTALLKPVPDGGIYLGTGGGFSPDLANAGYAATSLVIDRQLFWRIGLWLSGEASYVWRAPEDDLTARLCIGGRIDVWRSQTRKWRLIAEVSFVHMHEAALSIWRAYPLESILGESKFGLGHRSGVEVGAGLLITPWIESRNGFARRMRVMLRVSSQFMPDDAGPHFLLAFLTSVGVAL
jgi:hypothetical protein